MRSLAYSLLLRHLKQDPSCWSSLLPSYLAALTSGQGDRVEAALQHLPEFAVLAQQKVLFLLLLLLLLLTRSTVTLVT